MIVSIPNLIIVVNSLSASPRVALNWAWASISPWISSRVWTMNMSTRSSLGKGGGSERRAKETKAGGYTGSQEETKESKRQNSHNCKRDLPPGSIEPVVEGRGALSELEVERVDPLQDLEGRGQHHRTRNGWRLGQQLSYHRWQTRHGAAVSGCVWTGGHF